MGYGEVQGGMGRYGGTGRYRGGVQGGTGREREVMENYRVRK